MCICIFWNVWTDQTHSCSSCSFTRRKETLQVYNLQLHFCSLTNSWFVEKPSYKKSSIVIHILKKSSVILILKKKICLRIMSQKIIHYHLIIRGAYLITYHQNIHLVMRLFNLAREEVPSIPGDARVPWHPQILADHLTLSQPGLIDYAHPITTGTFGFSDLPTSIIKM